MQETAGTAPFALTSQASRGVKRTIFVLTGLTISFLLAQLLPNTTAEFQEFGCAFGVFSLIVVCLLALFCPAHRVELDRRRGILRVTRDSPIIPWRRRNYPVSEIAAVRLVPMRRIGQPFHFALRVRFSDHERAITLIKISETAKPKAERLAAEITRLAAQRRLTY